METTEAFFLCFALFCQPIQTPLAPFILLPLDCILPVTYPLLHLVVPWLDTALS